ncbi:MAG: alanine--tRNA ligase, partial [Candidatus Marinimicrobia bacterium]|nr:alanine--tRNA ligase [Candidatus Neomarinimicrobiota bacterium]
MKTSREIREDFIDFFRNHDHKIVKSAPVIPQNDPTLLFTNAGMNQFKGIFLGEENPKYPRIANSQKCIRVSGKHNDLEEVGKDTYHHTFFEMLGNWSFGDYYKEKAIELAWELLTEVWKFQKERLWVSIYKKDDESAKIWKEVTDIPSKRILRFGEKHNFWEMGNTGPCGPCSEIHYYIGNSPEKQDARNINIGDPEYIELWNLVFIQYDRDEKGVLHNLPSKHVDTGAGFERIVAALQEKKSNYDTDLFAPLIKRISEITGIDYTQEKGIPHRVIADHIRMLSFSIADGGMPSNEGRGYVIRRVLRRAARFSRMLNMHKPFMFQLVEPVTEIFGDIYPEILERKIHIQRVIKTEEESFSGILDRGLELFSTITEELKAKKKNVIPGPDVFKLYDTYGFPFDLTALLAEEKRFSIDENGFFNEMEKQRERARARVSFQVNKKCSIDKWIVITEGKDSEFVGCESESSNAIILRYLIDGDEIQIVLDRTPFYAESGGQVGDTGIITGKDFTINVENTFKSNDFIIHLGKLENGKISDNPEVFAKIDKEHRQKIRLNHTATHLLHSALRKVLGDHVHQSGSLVSPDRLRFDLTHYLKISPEELKEVEDIVNQKIRENIKVDIQNRDYEEAKKSGAMALFGEKYSDIVRVITIGEYSQELCGGTHVNRTGDIGYFKIISESSVAAGIRRIEAITGEAAIEEARRSENIISSLERITNISKDKLEKKIERLLKDIKTLEKELEKQNKIALEFQLKERIDNSPSVGELKIFTQQVDSKNIDEFKRMGDIVRSNLKEGVGVLATVIENEPLIVVVVADSTIKKYRIKAGDLVKTLGKILGG